MKPSLSCLVFLLLLAPAFPSGAVPPPPPDDVRVVRVIDGNTVVVTPYGDPFKVRLSCSRAPALARGPAGEASQATLAQLVPPGTWVTLASSRMAGDGVEQAEILPAGSAQPVNLTLVEQGLALWDHRPDSLCDRQRYSQAERAARESRLGLWGAAPTTPGVRP
ncbi:thermonuclease family protein [Cyanobium sp. FGCU-52]|nr:thermonuclease family protein [Cyanobium sp. FGCU52]